MAGAYLHYIVEEKRRYDINEMQHFIYCSLVSTLTESSFFYGYWLQCVISTLCDNVTASNTIAYYTV